MAVPYPSPNELFGGPAAPLMDPATLQNSMAAMGKDPKTDPVFQHPNDQLFYQLKMWVEEGRDRTADWRQETLQSYDITAGWQWDDNDLAALNQDNRPAVTFNRVGRNIDLISGMESQGREEVEFLPREQGDSGVSEVLSAGVAYINDETDAADEKSDAFRDLCICGMGWTNTVMDYRDFDEGMPVETRLDPLVMYWDPHSTRRNLRDSKWRARAKIMSMSEAQRMFPGWDPAMLNAAWLGLNDDPSQPVQPGRQSDSYEDRALSGRPPFLDRVVIVEVQWWEEEQFAIVDDLFTGERQELPRARARAIMASFPGRYEAVEVPRKVFYRAFLGGTLLEKQKLDKVRDFTLQCMTGKRDRKRGWYGMVRAMMDPQRWANKWLAQTMHIMNTSAKNTVLHEEGALVDGRRAQEAWSKPGAWVEVARGALSEKRLHVQQATPLPTELSNLMNFAMQSIQDCVGVNQEQLGMTGGTDANRAALLEHERRKAGITLMAHFFQSKRLFVKQQGRLLLRYMTNFMNDGRMVRITNEGNHQFVQMLIDDPDSIRYDIVVDSAPDSPNQIDKTWATLVPMLPMLERLQPPAEIWAQVIRYSPLPAVMKNKMAETIEQAAQQEGAEDPAEQAKATKDEAQAQKYMAEIEKIKAEIQKILSEIGLNQAKTVETGTRTEMDALEGLRETVAINDARELGKFTAHENA